MVLEQADVAPRGGAGYKRVLVENDFYAEVIFPGSRVRIHGKALRKSRTVSALLLLHPMFELSTKMSQKEFAALGRFLPAHKRGYAVAVSLCTLSDTEEASFGEESATVPSRWLSGVDVRDFAVQSRSWSDGLPIGSGHGSPYLQEPWAALMHQKLKTVEGRPNDGVRSSSPPPC